MNRLHLLIAGAVLFIFGLIVFGGPDMEEYKKRRAMKKTKSLVERITTYANKKSPSSMLGMKKKAPTGMIAGMDTSSDVISGEAMDKPNERVGRPGSDTITRLRNPYIEQLKKKPGYQRATPASEVPQQQQQQDPANPADGYYPPVTRSRGGDRSEATPSSDSKKDLIYTRRRSTQAADEKKLAAAVDVLKDKKYGGLVKSPSLTKEELEGIPLRFRTTYNALHESQRKTLFVAFEGTKAYTRGENGEIQQLADGQYEVPGSSYKISIRNGEKVRPGL